jgi:hypothetical protein
MDDEAIGPEPRPSRSGGVTFRSGTGTASVFWAVLALILGVVGDKTSGIASAVFWGISALTAVLGAINLGYYVTGGGRGRWSTREPGGESQSG